MDSLEMAKATPHKRHDGGKAASGYSGKGGDCVLRAAVIALTAAEAPESEYSAKVYKAVYSALADVREVEQARRIKFLERKLERKGLPPSQARELKRRYKAPKRSCNVGISKRTWEKFAQQAGFVKVTAKGKKPTVAEVAAKHERAIVVMRGHHLATVNGVVYDNGNSESREYMLWYASDVYGTRARCALSVWVPGLHSDAWLRSIMS